MVPPAGVELVLAGVAVAADEVVAAGVDGEPDEPGRLRAEGGQRRRLEDGPGHLLGPQAGHREGRPVLVARARPVPGSASSALSRRKSLGGGDDRGSAGGGRSRAPEVVGQQLEGRGQLAGGGQVVHRLDQRPAEEQGPDAVDRRPGEVRVAGSTTQAASCSRGLPSAGQQLGMERHARLDVRRLLGLAVERLVRRSRGRGCRGGSSRRRRRRRPGRGSRPASRAGTGGRGTGRSRAGRRGTPARPARRAARGRAARSPRRR